MVDVVGIFAPLTIPYDAWPTLPAAITTAILAVVQSAVNSSQEEDACSAGRIIPSVVAIMRRDKQVSWN
jgi:hypothetical protein